MNLLVSFGQFCSFGPSINYVVSNLEIWAKIFSARIGLACDLFPSAQKFYFSSKSENGHFFYQVIAYLLKLGSLPLWNPLLWKCISGYFTIIKITKTVFIQIKQTQKKTLSRWMDRKIQNYLVKFPTVNSQFFFSKRMVWSRSLYSWFSSPFLAVFSPNSFFCIEPIISVNLILRIIGIICFTFVRFSAKMPRSCFFCVMPWVTFSQNFRIHSKFFSAHHHPS